MIFLPRAVYENELKIGSAVGKHTVCQFWKFTFHTIWNFLKFMFYKKATKIDKIFTVDLMFTK